MPERTRIQQLLTWTGLVLLLVGAKLWLVAVAGSSLPAWDQVVGEGEWLLRPWVEGTLNAGHFWHPHNEHRIVLTKLGTLLMVQLNGQWDAYVQLVGNAVLHALFAPALLLWLRQRVQGHAFLVLTLVVSALWILPLTWENTLQGFQSQFYLLIWLAFLQIRGVVEAERFGWRWGLGQVCGLLALGAMGSGLLASAAVAAITATRMIRTRQASRFYLVTLGLSLTWVVAGWVSRHAVPGHASLAAGSIGEALIALAKVSGWPFQDFGPVALVFALPLPVLVVHRLWRGTFDAFDRTFFALAVWYGLVALAAAVYRANGYVLSSRYLDQYVIGLLLQGTALALWPWPRWRTGLIAVWVTALAVALAGRTHHEWTQALEPRADRMARQEANVRAFLATQDAGHLLNVPVDDIPFPTAEWLHHFWQHASIQTLMPAAVRSPVALPALPEEALAGLTPAPYPVVAASPNGPQTEPWIWRSERQPAGTLPILRFRFSGALGDPRAALRMRVVSDAWSVEVVPDGAARNRWKTINVIRPPGEWWIELADSDGAERVALTAPVELGWLSWAAEKLIKNHIWFIAVGLVLAVGGSLTGAPGRRGAESDEEVSA